MAFTYSGTAGAAGATIAITGSETLATLKTSLASNTSWATVNGNSIVFNATLSIGSGTTVGAFSGSDAVFIFPQAYTFTIPNNSAQSGSSTTLSDFEIIFDGSAKSYTNAINYGTHTWTRVVYRSQISTPRTDLFSNTGCVFNFNNVQLAVSSTATSYPYDFIHQYNNTSVTVQGLTIAGLGGSGSANTVEIGSATGTTTTLQGLVVGGNFGAITLNNGGLSYSGTQDFRSLSWPLNTTWTFNYGSGGGTAYITNPNKPSGWSGYAFLSGGAGGSGSIIERYTHDITTVNSAATGVVGVNSGDVRSGAFVWTATSGTGGVTPTQYVITSTLTGAYPGTLTTYSTSVTTAAWLYGYNTYVGGRTYSPTGVGITDTILMVADVTTLSASAVAALTSLATLDNLYDASRYFNTLNSTNIQLPSLGSNIITANGTQLNLGSYNLVINSGTTTAGNAFQVSGSTITIYSSSLAVGTKFTSFTTTGTITVNSGVTVSAPFTTTNTVTNSGTINAQYTSSAGTSGVLTFTGLLSTSQIYVANNSGVQQTYLSSSGTSQTFYYPPNSGATWTWKVTLYGYLPITGTFTSNTSSSNAINQLVDTGITQASASTVATYTTLTSLDNVYDYMAWYETQNAGIPYTRPFSKSGAQIALGSVPFTSNATSTPVLAYTGTAPTVTAITFKGTTLISGTTFGSILTTGTATFSNGAINHAVVYSSGGNSGIFTITGLTSTAVYLQNNSSTQQDYQSSITGIYTFYIPIGSTGTWKWVTKRSGYTYAFGTFNAATGGLYTAAPSLPQKLNPDGTVMYTGSSAALCTIVFTGTTEADITIGNGSVTVQVAFDSTETALATNAGMIWLTLKGECQQFLSAGGNFLFMSTGWRLKALNTSSPNAALYGYALSADGTPINAANGTVIILSTTLASQVAAAVWSTLTATQTTTGTFGNALQVINGNVQNASLLIPASNTI